MNAAGESECVAPVLLYDGVCGFCHGAVQFILRVDRPGRLRFAALDTPFAHEVITRHPGLAGVDSVVFVEEPGEAGEQVYVRSDAALRVADHLGWPWQSLGVAAVLPARARDWLYDRFAEIRYRVFGRLDSCPIPAPEVRERFIERLPTRPTDG